METLWETHTRWKKMITQVSKPPPLPLPFRPPPLPLGSRRRGKASEPKKKKSKTPAQCDSIDFKHVTAFVLEFHNFPGRVDFRPLLAGPVGRAAGLIVPPV